MELLLVVGLLTPTVTSFTSTFLAELINFGRKGIDFFFGGRKLLLSLLDHVFEPNSLGTLRVTASRSMGKLPMTFLEVVNLPLQFDTLRTPGVASVEPV